MENKSRTFVLMLVSFVVGFVLGNSLTDVLQGPLFSFGEFTESEYLEEDMGCNISGINLHGKLLTYTPVSGYETDFSSADDVLYYLDQAENDPFISAVILEVDSYGGSPVAAEEVSNKIKRMQKPVFGFARGAAASAGYWVLSATDRAFASEMSDIGSIGVTMSYLDSSKYNEEAGYTWNSISSGVFKDAGADQKSLTEKEREMFQRDIDLIFEKFVSVVAENRGMTEEEVRILADGSTLPGSLALEAGLIDEIGDLQSVSDYIGKEYGIEPAICW